METREKQLWEQYSKSNKCPVSRDALLDYYRPWAVIVYRSLMAELPGSNRDDDDLLQMALIGLWLAIEKYPYDSMEAKPNFRNFARMRIKGRILQEYRDFSTKYRLVCRKYGEEMAVKGQLPTGDTCVPDKILQEKEVFEVLSGLLGKMELRHRVALATAFAFRRGETSKSDLDKTKRDRGEALQFLKMMLEHVGIRRIPREHHPGIRLKASTPDRYHAYEVTSRKGGKYHYIGRYKTLTEALDAQKQYEEGI